MLLAYQGLPRIYNTKTDPLQPNSGWRVYAAVVTSIDPTSTKYQDSCQTAYQNFRLVDCGVEPLDPLDIFEPGDGCSNCLLPNKYAEIPFCDPDGQPCLVGIRNMGDTNGVWKEHCYIEVFFVGHFQKQEVPPVDGLTYAESTVLASLRWSATAEFMKATNGVMLNCTNNTT
jgi:hypothetical protein